MVDALVFAAVVFLLIAAGRQMLNHLHAPIILTTLERSLLGFAVALGLSGYIILALGLTGHLTAIDYILCVFLIVPASSEFLPMWRELRQLRMPRLTPIGWLMATVFALFAVTAVVGVYSPPTLLEWDALAYHLADPKIFAQHGRIVPLPWESHSEFAFNTEMWYIYGLGYHSIPLAKWFHCACGIGAALTTYAFGRRFFSHAVGIVAALIFVSTPLVFWEAGAAYADLATTFFTALTGLAVAIVLAPDASVSRRQGEAEQTEQSILPPNLGGRGGFYKLGDWALPATLMGFTLATKATALTTLGLLAIVIVFTLARRTNWPKAVTSATLWAVLALVVGSPYFIKSAVRTGNPIYPFYFQIFGGHGWSADRAQAYDVSNAAFGQGRRPVDFLLLPYNLTMALVPNHPLPARADAPMKQSFNDQQNILWTLSPVLLAALFFPLFGSKRGPRLLGPLAVYALGAVVLWFLTAQHIRYLLPNLPALCLLAAWAIAQAWQTGNVSGKVLAGFGGVSVVFGLAVAGLLVWVQGPVAIGLESKQHYLTAHVDDYGAMQFLNTQTPKSAKIVFYGNPFGFYCDRAYFWGDRQHSAFVPYDSLHTPADFLRWLKQNGVTHVLINRRYFNPVPGGGDTGAVSSLLPLCGPPVYDTRGIEIYQLP